MKKHFSVFMLMARFAFWPALIVSLGAPAAMFVCMLFFGERADELYLNRSSDDFFFPARIVLYVGLVLLVVLLMRSMRERGGVQPGYTLRRWPYSCTSPLPRRHFSATRSATRRRAWARPETSARWSCSTAAARPTP